MTCAMSSSHAVLELGWAYAMSLLHAVLELAMHIKCNYYMQFPISELMTYMPCPHYMQFWSLQGLCHATIICSSGRCMAYVMQSLNAISELIIYTQYPQLLLHIALHCFLSFCITLYHVALWALLTLWALHLGASTTCTMPSLHAVWSLGKHMPQPSYMQLCSLRGICHAIIICSFFYSTYAMPLLHAILELAGHMPYHHYMQGWSAQGTCHAIIKNNFWA